MTSSSSLYGSTSTQNSSSSNSTSLYGDAGTPIPDSSGNVIVRGTLTVNGCAILTNCSSFSFLPLNATSIGIGASATSISIGASSGTTTVNNDLVVDGTGTFAGDITATGADFGNITIGVATDNTITTTSGALVLDSATNVINVNANTTITGTLTVTGTIDTTDVQASTAINGINLYSNNTNQRVQVDDTDIQLTVNGRGWILNADGTTQFPDYKFPYLDGTANQVLITDGSGSLSFADVQSLDTNYTIDASATSGGANFNLQGSDATTDTIKLADGTGVTVSRTSANEIGFAIGQSVATGATPTFAGANLGNVTVGVATDNTISTTTLNLILDSATGVVNAKDIQATVGGAGPLGGLNLYSNDASNAIHLYDNFVQISSGLIPGADWVFNEDGTTNFPSYQFPYADGSANQVLTTNGAGVLSFTNNVNTTYDFNASSTTGGTNLNLVGSDSTTDTVKLSDGTGVSVSYISANEVSVSIGQPVGYSDTPNFTGVTISAPLPGLGGSSTFNMPTSASNINYYLPVSGGGANTVLTNDGSNNLTWALPGGGGSTFGNVTVGVDTDQTISTTSGNLVLQTAAGVDAGTITLASGANGNITLAPNGTGDIHLNSDAIRIGDNNATATIATRGTGDLVLTTHEGSAVEGTITIANGANGDITLAPNGTGSVILSDDSYVLGQLVATRNSAYVVPPSALTTVAGQNGIVVSSSSGGLGYGANIAVRYHSGDTTAGTANAAAIVLSGASGTNSAPGGVATNQVMGTTNYDGYTAGTSNNYASTIATTNQGAGTTGIQPLQAQGYARQAFTNSTTVTTAVTGASGTGTTATLNFTLQNTAPYIVGQTVTIAGMTPSGYNGTVVLTGVTTSSISYANTTTGFTSGGTIAAANTVTAAGTGFRVRGFANTTPMYVQNRFNFMDLTASNANFKSAAYSFANDVITGSTLTATNYMTLTSTGHTVGNIDNVTTFIRASGVTTGTRPVAFLRNTQTATVAPATGDGSTFRQTVAGSNGTVYNLTEIGGTYSSTGDTSIAFNIANGDQTTSTMSVVQPLVTKLSGTTISATASPTATAGANTLSTVAQFLPTSTLLSASGTTYANINSGSATFTNTGINNFIRTGAVAAQTPIVILRYSRTDQTGPQDNDGVDFRLSVGGTSTTANFARFDGVYKSSGDNEIGMSVSTDSFVTDTDRIYVGSRASTKIRATPSGGGTTSDIVTVTDLSVGMARAVAFAQYTTTQRNALSPAAGWVIWNTTDVKLQCYDGTNWQDLF